MNSVDFVDLVAKLRAAQKTYFKERTQSNLIEAKNLEAEVDRALEKEVVFQVSENKQPVLFEGEQEPHLPVTIIFWQMCQNCGNTFPQPPSSASSPTCPKCGSPNTWSIGGGK
jgi:rubrerythrin